MPRIILTSSFSRIARELHQKGLLPSQSVRVAFIPTAADVYAEKPWMEADRDALVELGYSVFDVDLKGKTAEQLKDLLEPAEIIFVAGGNTTYLVEHAHMSGFATLVPELLKGNRLYIGSSAGSILAGPTVEPFIEEELVDLPKDFVLHDPRGLHLVDFIVLPHYPSFAEPNDELIKKFGDKFTFLKMTDDEYRAI